MTDVSLDWYPIIDSVQSNAKNAAEIPHIGEISSVALEKMSASRDAIGFRPAQRSSTVSLVREFCARVQQSI